MIFKNVYRFNFVLFGLRYHFLLTDCLKLSVQTFYKNRKKPYFWPIARSKNGFLRFSPNLSILEYMLIHNTKINMATAHILVYRNKLYDHQERSYENQWDAKLSKVGVVKKGCGHELQKCGQGQFCSTWSKLPSPVVRSLLT